MVNPLIWLSLPGYRGALVQVWEELHLPLHPLDVLDTGLRQLGLTTPAALRDWLDTLSVGSWQTARPLWAYVPAEIQELAMQELGVDAIVQDVIIRSSTAFFARTQRRQQAPARGRGPPPDHPHLDPDRCPSEQVEELLENLRGTVAGIQRDGPPDPTFTWSHVVNAIIWLSLPRHRAALVNVWARLRLPLQPLETLAEGLRQLSLTTPGALRAWLSSLAADGQEVPLWA